MHLDSSSLELLNEFLQIDRYIHTPMCKLVFFNTSV